MNNSIRIFLLAIAFFGIYWSDAQTINVTGTVVDSATSQAVSGVLVKINEYPTVTTTTASNGTFTLANNITIYYAMSKQYMAEVALNGNRLNVISPEGKGKIGVDVFTCKGARIYHSEKEIGCVSFEGLWKVPGLYYIKVRYGSSALEFTSIGTNRMSILLTRSGVTHSAQTFATYTLQVSRDGYITKQVSLSSLVTSAGTIKISKSNEPPLGNPNPAGACTIPAEAQAITITTADHVIGTGTPASCTGDAFISAVALGGSITFNCGPNPVTITLSKPAQVFNNCPKQEIVIDGGGLVTLSGNNTNRIIYMNTCDQALHYTTNHCDNQDLPHLTVQNLTFKNGNARSITDGLKGGGGAIYASGGRFKAVSCKFFNNVCADNGPDVGGAAIRAWMQYNNKPVYLTKCTFGGGQGYGNVGSNGGGISSIGVSWSIYNCLFSYNRCTGYGGNPASSGTPGGGSGGAIYNDGNTMTLRICGTLIENNTVRAFGAAVFFVTNDHTGNIIIENSTFRNNTGGSWYPIASMPGVSMHSDTKYTVTNSTFQ